MAKHPKCFNAMPCGMGKTRSVLDFANLREYKTLIIVHARHVEHWKREIYKWAPELDADIHTYTTIYKPEVFYKVKETPYDIVYFDESHNLATWKGASRACIVLARHFKRCVFISATPCLHHADELYFRLKTCGVIPKMNKNDFMKRYCGAEFHPFVKRFLRGDPSNLDELMSRTFYVKKPNERPVEHTKVFVPYTGEKLDNTNIQEITANRQVISEVKTNYAKVCDLPEEKRVIVAYFTNDIDSLSERYPDALVLDGRTKNKESVVKKFNESDDAILIASHKVLETGYNLDNCNTMWIIDSPWSFGQLKQLYMRLDRWNEGEPETLNVYHFLTEYDISYKKAKEKHNMYRLVR